MTPAPLLRGQIIDFNDTKVEDYLSLAAPAPWCTYFWDSPTHHLALYAHIKPNTTAYHVEGTFPEDWRLIPGWHRHLDRDLTECFTSTTEPFHLHHPTLLPTAPVSTMLDPNDLQTIKHVPVAVGLSQVLRTKDEDL